MADKAQQVFAHTLRSPGGISLWGIHKNPIFGSDKLHDLKSSSSHSTIWQKNKKRTESQALILRVK
jgi:hypothetical protein